MSLVTKSYPFLKSAAELYPFRATHQKRIIICVFECGSNRICRGRSVGPILRTFGTFREFFFDNRFDLVKRQIKSLEGLTSNIFCKQLKFRHSCTLPSLRHLKHTARDLIAFDAFEQCFEIALAKAFVALALDEFEEHGANLGLGENLEEQARVASLG